MLTFNSPALTVSEHIALMRSRGLIIRDEAKASHYIQFIGYYRLQSYAIAFQINKQHTFRASTDFDQVLDLYIFDRKLRLLLLDAIERIEVAARATVNNTMCEALGPHWYMNKEAFDSEIDHSDLMDKLSDDMKCKNYQRKKREIFIDNYLKTFNIPSLPPGWMMAETLSMGTTSYLYSVLASDYQKQVASMFNIQHDVLESIFHALSYLRNLCAHHSRVWNRQFRIKPKVPKTLEYRGPHDRLAAFAVIIESLLQDIAPGADWFNNLEALMRQHPGVPRRSMGF